MKALLCCSLTAAQVAVPCTSRGRAQQILTQREKRLAKLGEEMGSGRFRLFSLSGNRATRCAGRQGDVCRL